MMQEYIRLKQEMEFVLGMMMLIPVYFAAAGVGYYLAYWRMKSERK